MGKALDKSERGRYATHFIRKRLMRLGRSGILAMQIPPTWQPAG
jgi:hypothetical protein